MGASLPSIFLAHMALSALQASSAPREPYSEAAVERAIAEAEGEVNDMAAAFGWSGSVSPVELGEIDTNARRVSLSRARLRELIGSFRGTDIADAARMILAHEVWHYVDLQRGSRMPAEAEERQVYECRADLMAGRYITRRLAGAADSAPPFALDREASDAHRLAQSLWSFGENGGPDYPSPQQRSAAAHYGALSTVRDNPGLSPEVRVTIEQTIDFRPGDSLEDWSRRACEMLTHFGRRALVSIGAREPIYQPASDGLRYRIYYENASSRAIAVSMTLIGWQAERVGNALRSTGRKWYFPRQFTLPPHGRFELSGLIPGVRNNEEFFLSYVPSDLNLPITARFDETARTELLPQLGRDLGPADIKLAQAIMRLASDAPWGFVRLRAGGATRSSNGLDFRSSVDVPDPAGTDRIIGSTSIQVMNEGSAFINRTFVSSAGEAEARGYYEEIIAAFSRIWPASPRRERQRQDERQFEIFVTRYARVRISCVSHEDRYSVFFTMAPNLTGLTEPDPEPAPEVQTEATRRTAAATAEGRSRPACARLDRP